MRDTSLQSKAFPLSTRERDGSECCGFVVVRRPHLNFDPESRLAGLRTVPQCNGVCYGGIERMEWSDLWEDKYAGRLPPDILGILDAMDDDPVFRGFHLKSCRDLHTAGRLLLYSNGTRSAQEVVRVYRERTAATEPEATCAQNANELIAVYSEEFAAWVGTVALELPYVRFLGYDAVTYEGASLLWAGPFFRPELFAGWPQRLNENGLFSTAAEVEAFVEVYASLGPDQVEPLPPEPCEWRVDAFAVYRLEGVQ